jgi:glycosyltransferase involved in cell wall biosynthesis
VIERFDLSRYDFIVSDSHAVAKGVRKHPRQRHLCYCHSPARFAWAMADLYGARAGSGRLAGPLVAHAMARFRAWDVQSSARVDHFVANSRHTALAILSRYGREADVVYPPVDVDRFADVGAGERRGYVTVSRLVPYKRIDLLLEAFARMPERSLTVIGEGPERAALERMRPANVTLSGRLPDDEVARRVGAARAFVFAAEEDFGIAVVEALAAGTPVIALDQGGVREIVRGLDDAAPTGVLFAPQDAAALTRAIDAFEAHAARIDAQACRESAARFAPARFRAAFAAVAARAGVPASVG